MPPRPARPTLVQRAAFRPGKCAVTGDIDGPFIDCGIEFENRGYWTRLYLHAPWVAQVARDQLGMLHADDRAVLEDRIEELEDENNALNMALDALHVAKEPA